MNLEKYIDTYDLKARVAPGLIMLFPVLFSIWVWFPITQTWANTISGSVFAIFLSWMIGRIASEKGLKVQKKLFKKWGGNLAAQLLRWDNTFLNPGDKKRFRKIIEKNIEGFILPTEEEEKADSAQADEKYEMAINWLRRNTRDESRFFLVFKENVNYGFHRNLFGLKGFAVSLYIMLCLFNVVTLWYGESWEIQNHVVNSVSSLAVGGISIAIWLFFINEKSVKSTAYAYGERLIEALEEFK